MRFKVFSEKNGEEEFWGYIEASSFDEARLNIKNELEENYQENSGFLLNKLNMDDFILELDDNDEEYMQYIDEELDDWADLQDEVIGIEDISEAHKKHIHPYDFKYKDIDRETDGTLKAIIAKGRPLNRKIVTKSQLARVKGETLHSKCVDCGAKIPYSTRPHERCERCQADHRRIRDRERKRSSRFRNMSAISRI